MRNTLGELLELSRCLPDQSSKGTYQAPFEIFAVPLHSEKELKTN